MHDDQQSPATVENHATAQPVDVQGAEDLDDMPRSRWPKVIGIIALIYAAGGLLCQAGIVLSSVLMEWLMELGGMNVETAPALRTSMAVQAIAAGLVGVVLLVGAFYLLGRRRLGARLVQTWAVLRLVLIAVGLASMFVLMPAQVEFQRSMLEAQAESLRNAGRSDLVEPIPSDEAMARSVALNTVIMSGLLAAFPIFTAAWFSRSRIREEVSGWT